MWKTVLAVLGLALLRPAVDGGGAPRMLPDGSPSLAHRLLVASEELRDPNFRRTVVLVLSHDADGAFGLVINRPIGRVPARVLLARMGLPTQDARGEIALAFGGPVSPELGFVLHTPEYRGVDTRLVREGIALSGDPRVLVDIAAGRGPEAYLALVGYAGWAPGQLEAELARGDWDVVDADPDLLFVVPPERRWEEARSRVAVEL